MVLSAAVQRALLATLLAAALPGLVAADPVAVRATSVPLNPQDPRQHVVGRLEYRGGLHLVSDDPRFGGISSLQVLPDGQRLAAVTDEGRWVSARLVHRDRRLVGIEDVEIGPLLGPDGKAPEGKDSRDAESLALLPDGEFIVGFEREHRLLRYPAGTGRPDGTPVLCPAPPGLEGAPFNGGIEALVALRGGGLLALTEYWIEEDQVVGWTGGPNAWKRLGMRFELALRPSDGALLPKGDVLILERAYNPQRGVVKVRIRQVGREKIRPGSALRGRLVAEFAPPVTLDNYEGISAVGDESGETHVYLVSDDNFNPAQQRTLLLMFALRK
ncbi:MAG TPA: esterase-like activity of phytase family protein [Vicinamibacteria bacterium]|nr:esterase-like activity of phytase family protein [Vicinamibacteria bacterium]